jgi:hypothetical protein
MWRCLCWLKWSHFGRTYRKLAVLSSETLLRSHHVVTTPRMLHLIKTAAGFSNLKKTDDDQYGWVKERIRKIPYLQYHAIRESNPRQMCHETLISYSIRTFWIILVEGISSWESLSKPDHEFNVMLSGVTKTSEYGEIEEMRRWRPTFCETTHLTFIKYIINVNGYCWNLEKLRNTSDKE